MNNIIIFISKKFKNLTFFLFTLVSLLLLWGTCEARTAINIGFGPMVAPSYAYGPQLVWMPAHWHQGYWVPGQYVEYGGMPVQYMWVGNDWHHRHHHHHH